jgi:hypothetical protein
MRYNLKTLTKINRFGPKNGCDSFLHFSEAPPDFTFKKIEIPCGYCKKYADGLCALFFNHIQSHVM